MIPAGRLTVPDRSNHQPSASAVLNVPALGTSTLLHSPSPSCAPTPPYKSMGPSSKTVRGVRLSPSPTPDTIFYTTGSGAPGGNWQMVSTKASHEHSSSRHSRLSADPTVPSLSLPEEMTEDPAGVGQGRQVKLAKQGQPCETFAGGEADREEQEKLVRDSISTSISRARQSSIPPRARPSGTLPAHH